MKNKKSKYDNGTLKVMYILAFWFGCFTFCAWGIDSKLSRLEIKHNGEDVVFMAVIFGTMLFLQTLNLIGTYNIRWSLEEKEKNDIDVDKYIDNIINE